VSLMKPSEHMTERKRGKREIERSANKSKAGKGDDEKAKRRRRTERQDEPMG